MIRRFPVLYTTEPLNCISTRSIRPAASHSLVSSPEPPGPLNRRRLGTKAPPAKRDRRLWGRECFSHWNEMTMKAWEKRVQESPPVTGFTFPALFDGCIFFIQSSDWLNALFVLVFDWPNEAPHVICFSWLYGRSLENRNFQNKKSFFSFMKSQMLQETELYGRQTIHAHLFWFDC